MDRSKWEYKKLGEVCEVLDKLRKPVTKSDRVTGQYPYYGATGIQDYVADYIFDGRYLLLGEDGAKWGANDKSSFIIEGKSWVNNHAHILRINEDYMDVFVMYYLNNKDLSEYITGAVVPKLTQAAMVKIPIPAISISDQQRIVAELDCLNEMIAVKQEQLKEFDKLAQSIFYDMFGDPVSNEKGWETYKLGELGLLARGVSKHRPRNAPELLGGTMPLIQTGDVANAEMFIMTYNSTYSDLGVAQSKVWKAGTLCITIAATIGKCAILSFDACFPDSVVGFMAENSKTNNEYMYFIFKRLQKILEMNAPAVAQKNINLAVLNALQIPLPPLALQQQFAEKISAIEAQKELVKQSIAETQALLDYSMDYYFNE